MNLPAFPGASRVLTAVVVLLGACNSTSGGPTTAMGGTGGQTQGGASGNSGQGGRTTTSGGSAGGTGGSAGQGGQTTASGGSAGGTGGSAGQGGQTIASGGNPSGTGGKSGQGGTGLQPDAAAGAGGGGGQGGNTSGPGADASDTVAGGAGGGPGPDGGGDAAKDATADANAVGNPRRVILCDEGNRRVLLVDLQSPGSAVWSTLINDPTKYGDGLRDLQLVGGDRVAASTAKGLCRARHQDRRDQEGGHQVHRCGEPAPPAERQHRARRELRRRRHAAGAGRPGCARGRTQGDVHEPYPVSHAPAHTAGHLPDWRGSQAGRGQLGQADPLGNDHPRRRLCLSGAALAGQDHRGHLGLRGRDPGHRPHGEEGADDHRRQERSPMRRPSSRTSTLDSRSCRMVTSWSPTGKAMAGAMAARASNSWNTTPPGRWYGSGSRMPSWCPRSTMSSSSTGSTPPSSTTTSMVCWPR